MQRNQRTVWITLIVAVAAVVAVGYMRTNRVVAQYDDEPNVTVRLIGEDGSLTPAAETARVKLDDTEWQSKLSVIEYKILRKKETERKFSSDLNDVKDDGYFLCAGCELPLFETKAKFESGTGWPSFYEPVAKENLHKELDWAIGVARTEVLCARCGGHLGHVFNDGPKPTGMRYCMNGEALNFVAKNEAPKFASKPKPAPAKPRLPLPEDDEALSENEEMATAVFAGGCFWCTEASFEGKDGILDVVSGYAGGPAETANYGAVIKGNTGHAEAIEITYDRSKATYGDLLRLFFEAHDPTTLNRQGPDRGTQYRSAIFVADDDQKRIASKYIEQLSEAKAFSREIVTSIEPLEKFYPAEDYHQDYIDNNPNNPYVRNYAVPKLKKQPKTLK